jgi:hypothetical protein
MLLCVFLEFIQIYQIDCGWFPLFSSEHEKFVVHLQMKKFLDQFFIFLLGQVEQNLFMFIMKSMSFYVLVLIFLFDYLDLRCSLTNILLFVLLLILGKPIINK